MLTLHDLEVQAIIYNEFVVTFRIWTRPTCTCRHESVERLSLTLRGLASNGKRQRWPLHLCSFLLIIVNRGEWLWNSSKFFVVCYCSVFSTWPCTKHNSCLLRTEALTNRNLLVMYFMHMQKIVQGRGPSNLNLGIFVCTFDVCRAS